MCHPRCTSISSALRLSQPDKVGACTCVHTGVCICVGKMYNYTFDVLCICVTKRWGMGFIYALHSGSHRLVCTVLLCVLRVTVYFYECVLYAVAEERRGCAAVRII